MRRLLVIFAMWSSLLFFAPMAAQAVSYECYCHVIGGPVGCTLKETLDAADDAAAGQKCMLACAAKSETMCKIQKTCDGGRTVCLTNPLNTASVPTLIGNIIKAATGIVGALALLIFVYGGFLWLTSGGEAAKVEQGKEAMKWAVIGLAVVFSSYALVSFVLSALKL